MGEIIKIIFGLLILCIVGPVLLAIIQAAAEIALWLIIGLGFLWLLASLDKASNKKSGSSSRKSGNPSLHSQAGSGLVNQKAAARPLARPTPSTQTPQLQLQPKQASTAKPAANAQMSPQRRPPAAPAQPNAGTASGNAAGGTAGTAPAQPASNVIYIYKEVKEDALQRGITQLCHFTRCSNLTGILRANRGLLPISYMSSAGLSYTPCDNSRWEGHPECICCTIEFPNAFFFAKARERSPDDWVVLLINPSYLWRASTLLSPCNASRGKGKYISKGPAAFRAMFADKSAGSEITRTDRQLACAPTDIQAEALIAERIAVSDITGMVFQSQKDADRAIESLATNNIRTNIPIYIENMFYVTYPLLNNINRGISPILTRYR